MKFFRTLIIIGLFVSFQFTFAQDLPSEEPLDAGRLAKLIRESIVVLTQFDRDNSEEGVGTGFCRFR